jgi:hypothetical protein
MGVPESKEGNSNTKPPAIPSQTSTTQGTASSSFKGNDTQRSQRSNLLSAMTSRVLTLNSTNSSSNQQSAMLISDKT